MGYLTADQRKALPKNAFGLPKVKGKGGKNEAGQGGYPMPDASHARNALARARQELNAGHLNYAQYKQIVSKAHSVLGKKGK